MAGTGLGSGSEEREQRRELQAEAPRLTYGAPLRLQANAETPTDSLLLNSQWVTGPRMRAIIALHSWLHLLTIARAKCLSLVLVVAVKPGSQQIS